jgi:hypothetical protein
VRQYVSFTGLHAGTVELSLGLHASRQLSDKVLRSHLLLSRPLPRVHIEGIGGSRFLAASSRRREGRTVSSPLDCGDRRTVSEGSDLFRDRPSLRIVRTVRLLPLARYARILGVSRIWPIFIKARVWNLKRVIVTPAVYWSFVPLKRAFRYQHWAGFSGRTQPFDLAATYVLGKQSGLPCHCDQPLARLAPLVPKVRG